MRNISLPWVKRISNQVKNFSIGSFQGGNTSNNINIASNFNQLKKKKEDLESDLDKSDDPQMYPLNYPNQMRPGLPSSREVMETCIIKNLISSYYQLVKKNISDLVPKTIMCFLVNESKRMAETEMINQLYKSSELDVLLQEDPYVARKRKTAKEGLVNLKKSLEVLSEIKDLKI